MYRIIQEVPYVRVRDYVTKGPLTILILFPHSYVLLKYVPCSISEHKLLQLALVNDSPIPITFVHTNMNHLLLTLDSLCKLINVVYEIHIAQEALKFVLTAIS